MGRYIGFLHVRGESMETVFIALLVVASVGIILATLMMEPVTKGMGSTYGQDTNVFGRSAHRSKEQLLRRITVVCAAIFVVASIMIAVL